MRGETARAVWLRLEKAGRQTPELAARSVADMWTRGGVLEAHTEAFAVWRAAKPSRAAPDPAQVGALSPAVLDGLRRLDRAPSTALVTASRRSVAHATRDKKSPSQLVAEADIDRLPEILARPRAVLFETNRENPMLLYVFDGPGRKAGKIVVRVRQPADRKGETNRVTTMAYVDAGTLADADRYTLLDGSLDEG